MKNNNVLLYAGIGVLVVMLFNIADNFTKDSGEGLTGLLMLAGVSLFSFILGVAGIACVVIAVVYLVRLFMR